MAEGISVGGAFLDIRARFKNVQSDAQAELRKMMGGLESEASSWFSKIGKTALIGVAGIGAAAAGIGAAAVEAADKFEKSHARLTAAVTASGRSFTAFEPQVSATSKAMEKLGFTNAQTEEALAHATVSLQDPAKAMKEMALAADLARFKNISLADATDVVDKALAGNLRGLKQLGIDLPIAATNAVKLKAADEAVAKAKAGVTAVLEKHSDAMNAGSKYHAQYEAAVRKVTAAQQKLSEEQHAGTDIIEALSQRLGGQAAAHAATFAGKMEILRATGEDLAKNLGLRLIPVLQKVAEWVLKAVQSFEEHWPELKAKYVEPVLTWFENNLLPGLVTIFKAIGNALEALGEFFSRHKALAIALGVVILALMSPITVVIGGVLLLATHWSQVWSDIKQWTSDAWHFLEHAFAEGIKALIDPFMAFVGDLLHGAAAAFGWIPGIGPKLKAARDDFDQFQRDVNASLDGIGKDPIKLTVDLTQFNAQMAAAGSQVRQLTTGGGGQGLPTFRVGQNVKAFDLGGWVDAPPGEPVPAIVHGAEFMLSRAMLAGRQPVPDVVAAALVPLSATPDVGGEELVPLAALVR